MFADIIYGTSFTTEDADALFESKVLKSSLLGGDVSLTSTLRAIIAPRMPDGVHLSQAVTRVEERSYNAVSDIVLPAYATQSDTLYIVNLAVPSSEIIDGMFSMVKQDFLAEYDGYEELEMIEGYFAKSFPMLCFINRDLRTSIIVVKRLDTRKLHLLQTAILAIMPWYYDPKNRDSITKDELALLESLGGKDYIAYATCLNELIKKYDMRAIRIRRLMDGFETRADNKRIESVKRELENCASTINSYNNAIAGLIRDRNEKQIILMGLKQKVAETEGKGSELMGYLIRNSRIDVADASDDIVTIIAKDYFEFFDEDLVERSLNYSYSDVYNMSSDSICAEDMVRLLRAIFLDKELKLRVAAAYQIRIGSGVNGLGRYDRDGMYEDAMPNPHIYYYECLGDYVRTLNQLVQENDYIGVVDQCLASVRSLNWGDSCVMEKFLNDMYDDGFRCVELPTGDVVYPSDAIAWLNGKAEREKREAELRAICFEEDDDEEDEEEEE